MRSTQTLPEGYKEWYSINLQKDKKAALFVNALSFVIAAVLVVPMIWAVPFSATFGGNGNIVRYIAMLVLMVVYMVLHELVHGAAMKLCGTKKVKYGFTGVYAFAGSTDYYAKKPYIFIALAPVVLWGAVLAIVNVLVPIEWFWVIYLVQVINLSGAAGDIVVTVKFWRFPKDCLIRDDGVSMTVYSKDE